MDSNNFNGFEDFIKFCRQCSNNQNNDEDNDEDNNEDNKRKGEDCDCKFGNKKGEASKCARESNSDIPGGFQDVNPQLFVIVTTIIGTVVANNLPFNMQNTIGNWFELLGQSIISFNAQQQYFQGGPGRFYDPIYRNVANPFCTSVSDETQKSIPVDSGTKETLKNEGRGKNKKSKNNRKTSKDREDKGNRESKNDRDSKNDREINDNRESSIGNKEVEELKKYVFELSCQIEELKKEIQEMKNKGME